MAMATVLMFNVKDKICSGSFVFANKEKNIF